MTGVLRDISVTCFLSSYVVVLFLELLRLAGRIPGRAVAVIGMTAIGIFTHVAFLSLGHHAGGLLTSWSEWSLLIALGLAICYLVIYLRRPETIVGFFFLPVILAMIALAVAVRGLPPFSRTEAVGIWRSIHGLSMMVGTGVVLLGFLAGMMCLVQSWRLKNHRAGSSLKLPTLETLLRWNRICLICGTIAVGLGLLAGVVMNVNRWGYVGWTSRDVLLSAALFAWLLLTSLFDAFYGPVSRGRKGVYLTIASGMFLAMAMAGVLTTSHGGSGNDVAPMQRDVEGGRGDEITNGRLQSSRCRGGVSRTIVIDRRIVGRRAAIIRRQVSALRIGGLVDLQSRRVVYRGQ